MKHLGALAIVLLSLAVAAPTPARAQTGYYGQTQGYHGVLTPQDQASFDKAYTKWVDASRKGDQDDIASNARKMQEIMGRNNIPPGVPFDQIASGGYNAYPANGAYGAPSRLSVDDQREFDKAYGKWVDASRKGDQDDIANNARKMQEIMMRYNIPQGTPFNAIATNGYAAAPNPNYGYAYGAPQALSAKDQADFDKYYRKWLDARHKRDMDDVDKNAKKMEEIMARYNIPANVPFDRIASGNYTYH